MFHPADLSEAVELVEMGKEKKNKILSKKEREIVSYHEVGHALVSALQKDAEPVQKITIVPRKGRYENNRKYSSTRYT